MQPAQKTGVAIASVVGFFQRNQEWAQEMGAAQLAKMAAGQSPSTHGAHLFR
ncbi:MAG: hypothetical protein O3A01_08150 [bacterium]|nr:hypothetical protein [bacterium]